MIETTLFQVDNIFGERPIFNMVHNISIIDLTQTANPDQSFVSFTRGLLLKSFH